MSDGAVQTPLLDGARNFRAVRPYAAADGRRLRENMLFRSGELSRLSARDLEILHGLNIRLVCDMRSRAEREEYVSRWPDGSLHRHLDLPDRERSDASPGKMFKMIASQPGEQGGVQAMDNVYRRNPHTYAANLKILFDTLLAGEALPLLVHCHAGKDRTGFMVAMLLAAAGVSRDDIMDDYEATSRFFPVEPETELVVAWAKRSYDVELTPVAARPIVEARRAYLDASFTEIETLAGGVHGYLTEIVGLSATDLARYRDLVLA
jgi:protein-tyrosine phosphatase